MTPEQIIMGLLGFACAVLGWLGRELWGAVQMLRKDLQSLEVRISSDYIRYDRLQDMLHPIIEKLDVISAALLNKADK
jgi:hypothetical protein